MPQIDAVKAARAFDRSIARCEDNRLALICGNNLRFGLRAGLLLDQEELAAIPVPPALAQQKHHLQREGYLAIKVLVQAVVASGFVVQHEGSGFALARFVAELEKSGVVGRIWCPRFAERFGPGVRHVGEMRICAGAQTSDDCR